MSTQAEVVPSWSLGDRLRKARRMAGIEQEDMARDIGRSARTITNYENDSTNAPLLVIRQYALRCGVPFEWLAGDSERPESLVISYKPPESDIVTPWYPTTTPIAA